jgi:hypothetical protein
MKILNKAEQDTFDKPPVFNSAERKQFFDFPRILLEKAEALRTPSTRIGFLLARAYFKADKRFFRPQDYHQRDIEYVSRRIGLLPEQFSIQNYGSRARQRHEIQILAYYGYRRFDKEAEIFIKNEIKSMMCAVLKPKLIFCRCIDMIIRERVQLPNYYQLSELILSALNQHKKELATIIDKELKPDMRILLDTLFEQENDDVYARYRLTLLKTLSQSTKPTKIKERAADLTFIAELYSRLAPILPLLNLGHEGIRYFATFVIKSDIFHLSRRSDEDRYVHLIAFIVHQYYRLQDNMADTLLTTVNAFQNSTKREHKEWCYGQHKEQKQSLNALATSLDKNLFGLLRKIQDITCDEQGNDSDKIEQICDLLAKHADSIPLSEQQWNTLVQGMKNISDDDQYYAILEERSIRLQNRISPIIKTLGFYGDSGGATLIEAITYYKEKQGVVSKNLPLGFLEPVEYAAVTKNDGFRPSLYKAFFFIHIANALKSGQLNLEHSYKYRPLDDYLISKIR